MNRLHRYLYWNMNYHIEHHMFPLVPYHATEKSNVFIGDKNKLAGGLIIGDQIECAKHNSRFSILDGSVKRSPVCVAIKTYEVKIKDDKVFLGVNYRPGEYIQLEIPSFENSLEYIEVEEPYRKTWRYS